MASPDGQDGARRRPILPGFHVYAQCLQGRPGGVALLAINASRTDTHSLSFQAVDRYTLSADKLDDTEVRLNGEPLKLQGGDVPQFHPERVPAGRMNFGPTTITFVAVPEAGNDSCR